MIAGDVITLFGGYLVATIMETGIVLAALWYIKRAIFDA